MGLSYNTETAVKRINQVNTERFKNYNNYDNSDPEVSVNVDDDNINERYSIIKGDTYAHVGVSSTTRYITFNLNNAKIKNINYYLFAGGAGNTAQLKLLTEDRDIAIIHLLAVGVPTSPTYYNFSDLDENIINGELTIQADLSRGIAGNISTDWGVRIEYILK